MMALAVVPHVNGVALLDADETPTVTELASRACAELLRQAAIAAELLDAADPPSQRGVMSEAAAEAIEALLEQELELPPADDAACRRHYVAHRAHFAIGERVRLRHVLFAVTPGVAMDALRGHAEDCLLQLRGQAADDGAFATAARELSNCPSGRAGGALGWLTASDCASEFAREVFGHAEVGVLPRLVRSRFGLHIVEVLERDPGSTPPYESVHDAVRQSLQRRAYAAALRQYVQLLAGSAVLEGVALDGAATRLVQ